MIEVAPNFFSIEATRQLCIPWIEAWDGDEWGEAMINLYRASHTDYAFSDADCALFASKLAEYTIKMKKWMDEEGRSYEISSDEIEAECARECRKLRDTWLSKSPQEAEKWQAIIDQFPKWIFGEEEES